VVYLYIQVRLDYYFFWRRNMLSYKNWKSLNESYDHSLGLAVPQSLGISSNTGSTLEELLAERKKMKKKMLGNTDMGNEDDDETGDGEMVEPTSLKDKLKDRGDDDMDGDDDDMDDDDGDDHGDEHGDDDEDAHDDNEGGDEEDGLDKANPLLSKIQMMKKKMKNKMKKKCSTGMKKKMKAEEVEVHSNEQNDFIQSISKMMSGGDGQTNWDGLGVRNEDQLLPYIDPNTGYAMNKEPGPGEVGYAPQGKVGDFFGN